MTTPGKATKPTLAIGAWSALLFCTPSAWAGLAARYVRVENPTGWLMEWQELEVFGGGQNLVLKHPEMFSGTVVEGHNPKTREGAALTDGRKDTHLRGADFRAAVDPLTHTPDINPWFEIDLGKPVEIDRIVLYGSRYPERLFMDKGHRLVTALDRDRRVVWAARWNYYDKARYPAGIFTFEPAAERNPVIGKHVPEHAGNWISLGWLLDAAEVQPPPDAVGRLRRFTQRNSPANTEKLARRFFALLADDVPELEAARHLFADGKYDEALESWKRYWFVKMRRVNLHAAIHGDYFTYTTQGDDLLQGIAVTIAPTSARAIRFTPGQIRWIDLPDPTDARALAEALADTEQKAQVGKVTRPLLDAYRRNPDVKYLQRWSEIMDDWSLNFFADAARTPYEAENLFTFNPAHQWGVLMEDLSDLAVEHPRLVDQVPATTLARVQLLCLEKYSTAWWRQARETVFNHETGGIFSWGLLLPYIDEFRPGRRARREWRQEFERWMTLGTEPDGSMTEIGDEGHMGMSALLGFPLARLELAKVKPDWYTPGWRNRALEWYDNTFKYLFRHLSPGGYEHRFAVGYRPDRWTSLTKPYFPNHPQNPPPLDRAGVIFAIPEIRRILDALGHISAGRPVVTDPLRRPVVEAQQQAHDAIRALLGNDQPGMPRINSDWMPYTGAYYFRSGWDDEAAFLAMMACGSHGGSQPTQWPYGMFYHYNYNYPLVRGQPTQIDGLPPNQLFGRRTYEPGTKTIALTYAEEKPAAHRWHSSDHFAFGEAIYRGAYQKLPGFKGPWDYRLEILPAGKALEDVQTSRQILQLRDSRLFIVTDMVERFAPADRSRTHHFSIPYKFALSTRQQQPTTPFSPDQLRIDEQATRVRTDNPDGPSVTFYQFAGFPLHYRRGSEAKVDFKSFAPRLTSNVGIAEQDVFAEFEGGSGLALVSLISSRPHDTEERVASIEPLNRGPTVAGFHAGLRGGGDIYYQAAASGSDRLVCGPAEATAQALLVVTGKASADVRGLLLGGKSLSIHGKPVALQHPDFEFSLAGTAGAAVQITDINRPVDPVSFRPGRNTFTDTLAVEMVSSTPHTQIRYTTVGTPPTRRSKLYTGPVTITASTEFAARAYRLGPDGKPLEADDFEVNGTRFTAPTYGWFYKKPFHPAVEVAAKDLEPGLNYDYLQGPWWRLYSSAHWLEAAGGGTAEREMDLSKVATHDSYGMRYQGYLRIPQDGVYTFHAPHELVYMDNAASYDLRLYLDGEEWYLTQWWHGHGTWSVPLRKGFHRFQVDFADARSTPWRKSGIWRYYPRSWVIYQGPPSDLLVSGPGLERSRIPQGWLYRQPLERTYADERVLVDSLAEWNCTADGIVAAPLASIDEICLRSADDPRHVFGGLTFVAAEGSERTFAELAPTLRLQGSGGAILLNLHGGFDHLAGTLHPDPKERATIFFHNSPAYRKARATLDP